MFQTNNWERTFFRHDIEFRLKKILPVHCRQGDYQSLLNPGRI